jgi:hypothetical protein
VSKQIHYYEFPIKAPEIEQLQTLFKRNLSKFNVPFFEAGSQAEQDFLKFCSGAGYSPQQKTITAYEPGKPNDDVRYLYLTLKDDRGRCIPDRNPDFIDLSAACPGSENFGICNRGARQTGRVVVAEAGYRLIDELDFIVTQFPLVPKIYLISEKLAQLFANAKATGCEILPCKSQSVCYQLSIVAKTTRPVKVGQTRISKRCSICGSVKLMFSNKERFFCESDLTNVDFQLCDLYETENAGTFSFPFSFPIVSKRIFDLLVDNKVKGLNRYTTDPPIKYAAVQIV